MPEDLFAKYKEIIKITQYEDMKGAMQEDPRRAYKRLKIQTDNEQGRQVFTQLQDGSVPSFEDFKAIKDKITRNNKGIGSNLSPLKLNESSEKTQ